jgi:hypothetical protein
MVAVPFPSRRQNDPTILVTPPEWCGLTQPWLPCQGRQFTAPITPLSVCEATQAWDVRRLADLLGVLEGRVLRKIRIRATAYRQLPGGRPPEMPGRPHSFCKPEEDEE